MMGSPSIKLKSNGALRPFKIAKPIWELKCFFFNAKPNDLFPYNLCFFLNYMQSQSLSKVLERCDNVSKGSTLSKCAISSKRRISKNMQYFAVGLSPFSRTLNEGNIRLKSKVSKTTKKVEVKSIYKKTCRLQNIVEVTPVNM